MFESKLEAISLGWLHGVMVICLVGLLTLAPHRAHGQGGLNSRSINRSLQILEVPGQANVQVQFERVFPRLTFNLPVMMLDPDDGTERYFVVELGGTIKSFVYSEDPDPASVVTYLNIPVNRQLDSGLLGATFDPNFTTNGYIYLHFQRGQQDNVSNPHRSVIARYQAVPPNAPTIDPATEEVLLEIDQEYTNHNGGNLVFDPLDDRMLYIAMGDGGHQEDPFGHGQNTATLLGSLLRIDVHSTPTAGLAYKIPDDNPFVGHPTAREEIYAYGFRSLWRIAFDQQNPNIFFGADVGQYNWEEVNILEKGKNYGWSIMEGTHCHPPSVSNCDTSGLTLPIIEYGHDVGESITGGYVYYGSNVPALYGAYIFGDYDTGRVWASFYDESTGTATLPVELINHANFELASFAQDRTGEVYAIELVSGRILGFQPGGVTAPGQVPQTLSEAPVLYEAASGQDVTDQGVVPYEPSAKLWSDHAVKERYFALPDFKAHGLLLHRWSFNGTLEDSAGDSDARIIEVGGNNATLTASGITLAGGAKNNSDYVLLGQNLLPEAELPVTIEVWATPHTVKQWSRIFDFGVSTTENLFMSWTRGGNLNTDRVEWLDAGASRIDDSNQPYTLGQEYHIVMTIQPGAGVGGQTRVTWYSGAANAPNLGAAQGTFDTVNRISELDDAFNYLGRSQWPDETANATYNEVRIWSGALTPAELEQLHDAGPVADPPLVPELPTIGYRQAGGWDFPNDTVIIKNFSLPLDRRDTTNSLQRIETRLLIRNDETWHGFSYEWNQAQTDATLLDDATTRTFSVIDEMGQTVNQTWYYPSREDCLTCHTPAANFVLGLNTPQMNQEFRYPHSGESANQLEAYQGVGLFDQSLPAPADDLPRMPDAFDTSAGLEPRARAYLAANCSMCHQPEGGAQAGIDLRWETPLNDTNTLRMIPNAGNLGLPNARIIAPGQPERSVLLERIHTVDPDKRMPPLATSVEDKAGVDLIREWIAGMEGLSGAAQQWHQYR